MFEQKPQTVHNIPVWGVFLLFLGVVFLLQTLNALPWGLWGNLWRFWPVLIIIIGLGILLRRYNPWLVSLLILAILFACLGIAIAQYRFPPPGQTTKSYSEPLSSLESAQIEIHFTAGSLSIGSLHPSSPNFVEANSKVRNGDGAIEVSFRRQDSNGRLHLTTERVNRQFWNESNWEVRFTRNIPLTIDVKSAVGNLDLDLSELVVTELRMDLDAGNYRVKMPSSAGTTRAYIKVDVANVEMIIPGEVAVRLKADVDLAALEVDESRFPRKGDYYMSEDFESAENRVELELECNIGRAQVK